MTGFLLDTIVVSEAVRKTPDINVSRWLQSVRDDLLYLSVITIGEIRRGIALQTSTARQAHLQAWLDVDIRRQFRGRILNIDEEIAERCGVLTAVARLRGSPLPQADALLAATALHHKLTLVTRNTRYFVTDGVSVLNPWEL